MKVTKTGRSNAASKSKNNKSPVAKGKSGDKKNAVDTVDTVELSTEAIAASQCEDAAPVEAVVETMADGPLPDPYETSKKMLEKELKKVFKATYLGNV